MTVECVALLDSALRIRIADYARPAKAIVPNPNAPTGIALARCLDMDQS
jgi:hypothetical protein